MVQEKDSAEQIEQHKKRQKELARIMDQLYSDRLHGKLSDENFYRMTEKIQDEQERIAETVKTLKEISKETEQKREDALKWLELIRQYKNIKKLDYDILHQLIRCIVIHEYFDEWGNRSLTVEIHFNFIAQPDMITL